MLLSILPLTSNHILPLFRKPQFLTIRIEPFTKSQICFAIPPSNKDPIGEENRWLREESRWLREEQRWLREESRWSAERQALLQEISNLQLRIQQLERLNSSQGSSVTETVANIAKLLQVLKEGDLGKNVNRLSDSGSGPAPLVVEAANIEDEIVVKEVISIPDKKEPVRKKSTMLRMGSEGDDVRDMQEALQKLGFYSGEEDMEFSSFASGTQRAVKTWQASIGVREDGIMSTELLQQLFENSSFETEKHEGNILEKSAKRVTVAATTDVSAPIEKRVTKESVTEISTTDNRVFLLGENRWEDPSRLSANKRPITNGRSGNIITKCVSCRGEGRLLCMECDGTGEPNVEEQFMEWVDEGAKCPYCDGLGHVTCDACGGSK